MKFILQVHPDLSKSGKKQLCRILDCQKLSPQVCMHAVRNERLPLRTVVQLLYFEQERGTRATASEVTTPKQAPISIQRIPTLKDGLRRLNLQDSDEQPHKAGDNRRRRAPVHDDKEESNSSRGVWRMESRKGREIVEEGMSGSTKLRPRSQRTERTVHKHSIAKGIQ